MSKDPPETIPELWYVLDKRLSRIEDATNFHHIIHTDIQKVLDDHEARIRSGMTFTSIMVGAGSLFSLIAIIKSFLP